MALAVGSRLGHYDVTALIGEGGMGVVYRATNTRMDRCFAIKVSLDHEDRTLEMDRDPQPPRHDHGTSVEMLDDSMGRLTSITTLWRSGLDENDVA